jgi:SAM-dependent methyltransferase
VFEDIVRLANLSPDDKAIEIGAGTGIATQPLVECGLDVTAIEPAAALAAVAESNLTGQARFVVGRFEDFSPDSSVKLLAAFNAWHWVEPGSAVDRAAQLLEPGGSLALVWTVVVSWGEEPFEERLAETLVPLGTNNSNMMLMVQCTRFDVMLGSVSFKPITIPSNAHSTPRPSSLSPKRTEVIERLSNTRPLRGSSMTTSADPSRKWRMQFSISHLGCSERAVAS